MSKAEPKMMRICQQRGWRGLLADCGDDLSIKSHLELCVGITLFGDFEKNDVVGALSVVVGGSSCYLN